MIFKKKITTPPQQSIKVPASHQFADSVKHQVDDLFADGVMSTSVVVGCILLSSDQLLRVEELAVSARANLI